MEPNPLEITVGDGKYTVVQTPDGQLSVLRNGEPWRDLTGDKLVLCLAQELDAARAEILFLLRRDSEELLKRIDTLEAENASLHKQIDQLTDDLARAREGDL